MNQTKASTIKEATYNSADYYLGLDYLTKNHPGNFHLKSCYEGVSFRNLARCITHDRSGKALKLNNYLKRPQRFVLTSSSGAIVGVMVKTSLPEFYQEIEYEDYVVISTDIAAYYDMFLNYLSFDSKAEIVTFNASQAKLVRTRFPIKKTHYWSVFAYRGATPVNNTTNIRLMDSSDFVMAKQLSKRLPEESSPLRLLQFQLNGLPYKNYALSFNGMPSVFVGSGPYSERVCQLNYLVGTQNNRRYLQTAIEAIGKLVQDSGCDLIWRLRQKDALRNKALIRKSGFVEISKESHLHLNCHLQKHKIKTNTQQQGVKNE